MMNKQLTNINNFRTMKREIKFRAWDGERFYNFDMFTDKGNFTLTYNDVSGWNVNREPSKPQDKWLCGDSADTTMEMDEFTGLKDKNGVDIYEGDILQRTESEWHNVRLIKWTVGFIHCCFFRISSLDIRTPLGNEINQFEVIGNIHENKNLLK